MLDLTLPELRALSYGDVRCALWYREGKSLAELMHRIAEEEDQKRHGS